MAPEAAGLGAGAGTGVLTANPIVGVAVGLAVRLATDEGIGYVKNEQQRQVQQAIATAAGNAPDSDPVQWSTDPDAFYGALFGSVGGRVQVVRDFGGRIQCREVVYTVKEDGGVEGLIDDPGTELQNIDTDDGTSADQPKQARERSVAGCFGVAAGRGHLQRAAGLAVGGRRTCERRPVTAGLSAVPVSVVR